MPMGARRYTVLTTRTSSGRWVRAWDPSTRAPRGPPVVSREAPRAAPCCRDGEPVSSVPAALSLRGPSHTQREGGRERGRERTRGGARGKRAHLGVRRSPT